MKITHNPHGTRWQRQRIDRQKYSFLSESYLALVRLMAAETAEDRKQDEDGGDDKSRTTGP